MFYYCGSIEDYSYVYDTSDNSCELVKNEKLDGILVQKKADRGSLSLSKLKMLYGFTETTFDLVLGLCEYEIGFIGIGKECAHLYLRCVDMSSNAVLFRGSSLYDFKYDNYIMFLIIHQIYNFTSNPEFRSTPSLSKLIIESEGSYMCLPVPLQMVDYTVKLAKAHNFKGLDRAYGGAIFTNLRRTTSDTGSYWRAKLALNESTIDWSV